MSLSRLGGLFTDHKFAIANVALKLGAQLFNHSWAATAQNYSLSWKVAYLGIEPLLEAALAGVVGHGVDKITTVAAHLETEPSSSRNAAAFFYKNKFAIAGMTLDLAIVLFNHSWAVTSENYSLGWKITYMALIPAFEAARWGIAGHGVDKAVEAANSLVTESSRLLQSRM